MQHLSRQTAPCRAKLTIILEAMLVPYHFLNAAQSPKDELEAGGQLVLQAASSAKSPKTMNKEIQRGLVQSAAPLTPNGPLLDELDDHA